MSTSETGRTFGAEAEAEAWVARYERDRCKCGGSPEWINPRDQLHRADCPRVRPLVGDGMGDETVAPGEPTEG